MSPPCAVDVLQIPQHQIGLLEQIDKRPIALFERLPEDVVEVADRLVIVQGQAEVNVGRHVR